MSDETQYPIPEPVEPFIHPNIRTNPDIFDLKTSFHNEPFDVAAFIDKVMKRAKETADDMQIKTGTAVSDVAISYYHWTYGRMFSFVVVIRFQEVPGKALREPYLCDHARKRLMDIERASRMFLN